jgi:ribonuclease HII
MRWLGIDEAGRGCVLGAMVVAGFVLDADDDHALADAGATDSKKLSPKRRVAVRAKLEALGTGDARCIEPVMLDAHSLNALEEDVVLDLVRRWRPDHVVMDALGPPRTLPALIARFQRALEPDGLRPTWTVAPKADLDFPVCGAASIFAKTTRDDALERLKLTWGNLGSGYPGDEVTRAWLLAHARTGAPWPPFVRTKWSTIPDIEALARGTSA